MAKTTAQRIALHKEHEDYARSFLDVAGEISRREGWREYDVFVKWLEAATCSLMNPVLKIVSPDVEWLKNEERYMQIVRACKHPRTTMYDMARMLSFTTMALEERASDFLGPVFMEVAASAQMGQFFTPSPLSEMCARMVLDDPYAMLAAAYAEEGRTFITLSEPACGVGSMVLEAHKVLREHHIDTATETHWVVTDVDWKAVCGAYIQLSLAGVSAVVVHGDTLKLQEWGRLRTIVSVLHPKRCN